MDMEGGKGRVAVRLRTRGVGLQQLPHVDAGMLSERGEMI